jgi:hypothetical protein
MDIMERERVGGVLITNYVSERGGFVVSVILTPVLNIYLIAE